MLTLYLVCLIIGGALVALSIFGGGDVDVDADVSADFDLDSDASGAGADVSADASVDSDASGAEAEGVEVSARFLSLRSAVFFSAFFGLTGTLLTLLAIPVFLTAIFAVDLSASGQFGTVNKMKNELAAEFCAVLAFAAAKNNDKVGLLIFTDQVELYIPPKKGSRHVLRLIRELLYFKMPRRRTNISMALDYLAKVTRKRATIFLVSDFIETDLTAF